MGGGAVVIFSAKEVVLGGVGDLFLALDDGLNEEVSGEKLGHPGPGGYVWLLHLGGCCGLLGDKEFSVYYVYALLGMG